MYQICVCIAFDQLLTNMYTKIAHGHFMLIHFCIVMLTFSQKSDRGDLEACLINDDILEIHFFRDLFL